MKLDDLEKIKTLFSTAFSEKKALTALDKYADKKDMYASYYMVYSFAALPALIEKLKQLDSWGQSEKYTARFVIDGNGAIWFAFEGRPGDEIEFAHPVNSVGRIQEQAPAHSDMTPDHSCIAAGIVVFSDDYKIRKITNFSGHFRPHPSTLVWPVAALINLGADFTNDVELGFFWKNAHTPLKRKTVSFQKTELQALLPEGSISSPSLAYEICVCSLGRWEYFGEGQTPQFQIKLERPEPSTFKRKRSTVSLREGSSLCFFPEFNPSSSCSSLPVQNSASAIPGSPSKESSSSLPGNLVLNKAASFNYDSPPQSPKRLFYSGNSINEPFSDIDSDHEDMLLLHSTLTK